MELIKQFVAKLMLKFKKILILEKAEKGPFFVGFVS